MEEIKMEEKNLKMIINKSGSSTGWSGRVSIPKTWLDKLKIDQENRDIKITLKKDEIIVKKA